MGGKDETNIIIVPIFFIGGMLACFGKKGHKAATDGRREGERTKYPAIKILWKRKKEIPNLVIRTSLEGRVPSFFLFFSVKTDVGHDFYYHRLLLLLVVPKGISSSLIPAEP